MFCADILNVISKTAAIRVNLVFIFSVFLSTRILLLRFFWNITVNVYSISYLLLPPPPLLCDEEDDELPDDPEELWPPPLYPPELPELLLLLPPEYEEPLLLLPPEYDELPLLLPELPELLREGEEYCTDDDEDLDGAEYPEELLPLLLLVVVPLLVVP